MDWAKLNKPPLREAIVDIRFSTGQNMSVDKIQEFCFSTKGEYPEITEIISLNVLGDKDGGVTSTKTKDGFRISNSKNSLIVELKTDRFTFVKTYPYISWEEIQEGFQPLLKKLSSFFPDLKISRIGLRYVNVFNLRIEKQPQEYFNVLPFFNGKLAYSVDGFDIKLLIPKKEDDSKSVVFLSVAPAEGTHQITLDINVFKESEYELTNIDTLFDDLLQLRDFKNHLFFNTLSKTTLENFN